MSRYALSDPHLDLNFSENWTVPFECSDGLLTSFSLKVKSRQYLRGLIHVEARPIASVTAATTNTKQVKDILSSPEESRSLHQSVNEDVDALEVNRSLLLPTQIIIIRLRYFIEFPNS